jgi:hypothetical protein
MQDKDPAQIFNSNHKGVKALLLTSTVGTFVFGLFSPFYAVYVQRLGGTVELAGTTWAVFSIVSGVLILAFSSLEASIRDKKVLYVSGLMIRSLVFVLYIFISSYYELILAQILLGISVALTNPAFDALFTNQTSKQEAITDWGGWEGFTAIAAGSASLLGGYFIGEFGFGPIFGGMAILNLSICLYILLLPKSVLE